MSDLINMLRVLETETTPVYEHDDPGAVRDTWYMVREIAQKYVDFAQSLNQWCGTDEAAAALPFEPPWYADLFALVSSGGEFEGIVHLKEVGE